MSKLIQLRHRINAIETIKKITHAMRLISMSAHSQLKQSREIINEYRRELDGLFFQLYSYAPKWQNHVLHPDQKSSRTMFILVASQKGLCGSFNTMLFKQAAKKLNELKGEVDVIPIGQKASDYCNSIAPGSIKHAYNKFSLTYAPEIAYEISHSLLHMQPTYKEVYIASNRFKNFFVQEPKITQLIPFEQSEASSYAEKGDLIWEQPPEELLDQMVPGYVTSHLQSLLYDSLLAEHAARFVSMDSATRNADTLLEATNLEYNKLRQAKITKELTELSGSF